jgi:hypothetical protein
MCNQPPFNVKNPYTARLLEIEFAGIKKTA